MKGKIATNQTPTVEPGTYEATLERVTAWSALKYQSTNDYEPTLTFVWNLGEDDSGNPIRMYDAYVRIPLSQDGYPVLKGAGKLYNRVSALYGTRFDAHDPNLDWELQLPDMYDSPEGLEALPRIEERNDEGFRPVEVRSIKIAGRELIGQSCLLVVGEKNGRIRVLEANPAPRSPKRQLLY